MYGIYANIGCILMVNVTIYTIHGSYGYENDNFWKTVPSGYVKIAIENGPFIVDLPIKHGDFP